MLSGTANGKRVQANMGAKNHCVIMPDGEEYFPTLSNRQLIRRSQPQSHAQCRRGSCVRCGGTAVYGAFCWYVA